MRFNVAQLLQDPEGSKRTYILKENIEPGESGRAKGKVDLTRTDKGIWAHGELQVATTLLCGRCLESVHLSLGFTFDEEYVPEEEIASELAADSEADISDLFIIDGSHTLDLSEAVRQYTVAGLPMKPLCREDCRGLCPQCGINLNDAACSCPKRPIGPRTNALGDMLAKNA